MDETLDKSEILSLLYHVMVSDTPMWREAAKQLAEKIGGTDKSLVLRDAAR